MSSRTAGKCRVCGMPSAMIHFGVRTCRACAAFFRRSTVLQCAYTCKHQNKCPISIATRSMCRACRLRKCHEAGMVAISEAIYGAEENVSDVPPSSRLLGNSQVFKHLRQLSRAYSELKALRMEVHGEEPPRLINTMEMNAMHLREAKHVAAFPMNAFDEAKWLPFEQFKLLNFHFYYLFYVVETAFYTYPTGQHTVMHMPGNVFYDQLNPQTYALHYDGTPNQHATKVADLFKRHMELNLQLMIKPMSELRIDETEFLAVAALLFWFKEVDGLTEQTITTSSKMRKAIISELIEHIRMKSPAERPGIRLSQVVLLVANTQKIAEALREMFEVHRVLGLYKVDPRIFDAINGPFEAS